MTNFEKYKDKILKIATENNCSPAKKDGVVIPCGSLECEECDFSGNGTCAGNRFKWLCEDDGEQELTCSSCRYASKDEKEYPCSECSRGYIDMFKLKPKKTRQSKFLELFPNAKILNGVLDVMPCKIAGREFQERNCNTYYYCETCCKEYWLKEVKEQ